MTLTAGATLQNGRYVIQSVLSYGTIDITYEALHTYLNQTVHIKTLQDRFRSRYEDVSLRQEFIQRATGFAQSSNPHLIRVIDGFEEDWMPFLVLKSLSGKTVESWLQGDLSAKEAEPIVESSASESSTQGASPAPVHPVPLPRILEMLHQLVPAVRSLHEWGIAHGQISPQTIVIREETQDVVLGGMGLRSLLPSLAAEELDQDTPSEQPGPMSGDTQADIHTQADIQGLAATLYALLTGQVTPLSDLMTQSALPALYQQRLDLDTAVESVLLRGLNPTENETVESWFFAVELALEPASVSAPMADMEKKAIVKTEHGATVSPTDPLSSQGAAPVLTASPKQSFSNNRFSRTRWVPQRRRSWRLPLALGLTSVVAVLGGGHLGLSFRLQTPERLERSPIFGSDIFSSEQSFPPSTHWPGESDYDDPSSRPLFEQAAPDAVYSVPTQPSVSSSPELLDTGVDSSSLDYEVWDDVNLGAEAENDWTWETPVIESPVMDEPPTPSPPVPVPEPATGSLPSEPDVPPSTGEPSIPRVVEPSEIPVNELPPATERSRTGEPDRPKAPLSDGMQRLESDLS